MKILLTAGLFIVPFMLMGQNKNNEWHLDGTGYLAKDSKKGIGLGIKYLKALGEDNFITAGLSFNLFQLKSNDGLNPVKKTLPLLLGYRQNLKKFYLEPQLGIGTYGGRFYTPEFALPSQFAIFAGAESGYNLNRFSFHLKCYTAFTQTNIYLEKTFLYGGAGIAYKIVVK